MATRFVNIDRDTPLLLPPDLRDWVPANPLAHFILDAVEALDLREVNVNTRGTGDAQYPPAMLLVGARVSQAPNDQQELVPTLAAVAPAAGPVASVLVDRGFFSEAAVRQVEQTAACTPTGTVVYAPLDKTSHPRSVADLEKRPEPAALAAGANVSDWLRYRLKTSAGKARYK